MRFVPWPALHPFILYLSLHSVALILVFNRQITFPRANPWPKFNKLGSLRRVVIPTRRVGHFRPIATMDGKSGLTVGHGQLERYRVIAAVAPSVDSCSRMERSRVPRISQRWGRKDVRHVEGIEQCLEQERASSDDAVFSSGPTAAHLVGVDDLDGELGLGMLTFTAETMRRRRHTIDQFRWQTREKFTESNAKFRSCYAARQQISDPRKPVILEFFKPDGNSDVSWAILAAVIAYIYTRESLTCPVLRPTVPEAFRAPGGMERNQKRH
ncbi:hypothetical protein B0H14DRAFT_3604297 [Mycena olivaceomarginata]|nr:hypothetical protein B0H14DRAFT_3604297 [Mycena olivaceomarginata]